MEGNTRLVDYLLIDLPFFFVKGFPNNLGCYILSTNDQTATVPMHPYKIIYLPSTISKKKTDSLQKGNIDGMVISHEMEALLIEQDKEGYDLISITPIVGTVIASPYSISTTTGFMVTFKPKTSDQHAA